MNQTIKVGLLTLVFGGLLIVQGCKRTNEESTTSAPVTAPNATVEQGHAPEQIIGQSSDTGFISMGNYKFKMDPEIGKNGETHLDLYVHDQKDQHVSEAQVVVHITASDGHKSTVNLTEDKAEKHYTGKTTLDDMGDYQAVAQVTVNGEKVNPRFNFTRNQ